MHKIERTCPRCNKRLYHFLETHRLVPHAVCADCGHKWQVKAMAPKWFAVNRRSYEDGATFIGKSAYADAVREAQDICQTDKRPKRLARGFYQLDGCKDSDGYVHSVWIGTVKGFDNQGIEVR